MKVLKIRNPNLQWVLFLGIVILGFALRVFRLDADVPWDLTWSQGVLTDGPWYVDTAISKIKHIPAMMEDKLHQHAIFTYLALGVFKMFGVGWKQLNFIPVIPGLLSVVFLGLIFYRQKRPQAMLLSTLFLSINFFFLFYNRTPKIYSAVAFFCIFSLWLWTFGERRKIYFYLSYSVILLAVIYLKVFIVILLPILIYMQVIYFSDSKANFKKWFSGHSLIVSIVIACLAFALLGIVKNRLYWVSEKIRVYTLHHEDFESVLIKIPLSNWLFIYSKMMAEIFLAYVYFLFVLYRKTGRTTLGRALDLVACFVVGLGNLAFFVFQYYPPRFYVFMIPFICYLATSAVAELLKPSPPNKIKRKKWLPFLVAFWLWFLFYHLLCILVPDVMEQFFFLAMLALICISLALAFYLHAKIFLKRKLVCRPLLVYVLIGMTILFHGWQYFLWALHPKYSVKTAINEAHVLIPENAVLAGPYAHLLGLTSDFMKYYQGFNYTPKEPVLNELMRHGVTHLVVDVSATMEDMRVNHSELFDNLLPMGSFFIHGFEIQTYRVIPPIGDVSLTSFERVAQKMNEKDYSPQVQADIESLPTEIKNTSQTRHWEGMLEMMFGDPVRGIASFKKVLEQNPNFAPSAYQLATYALESGDHESANKYLLEAIRNVERTPPTLSSLDHDWNERLKRLQK